MAFILLSPAHIMHTFLCVSHEDFGEVEQTGGKWGDMRAGSESSQNINNG